MKSTDWRTLPEAWKECIAISLYLEKNEIDINEWNKIKNEHDEETCLKPIDAFLKLTGEKINYPLWPDLHFLHEIVSLRTILLHSEDIDSAFPLMYFPLLEYIDLENCATEELDGLMLLSNVKYLNLKNSYVDQLLDLDGLSLETLNLSNTYVENLFPLFQMKTLKNLDVSNTKLTSLEGILEHQELNDLIITGLDIEEKELEMIKKNNPHCQIIL